MSMSPSLRSACSTSAANQASGIRPRFIKIEQGGDQLGMGGGRDLAMIRDLAGVP